MSSSESPFHFLEISGKWVLAWSCKNRVLFTYWYKQPTNFLEFHCTEYLGRISCPPKCNLGGSAPSFPSSWPLFSNAPSRQPFQGNSHFPGGAFCGCFPYCHYECWCCLWFHFLCDLCCSWQLPWQRFSPQPGGQVNSLSWPVVCSAACVSVDRLMQKPPSWLLGLASWIWTWALAAGSPTQPCRLPFRWAKGKCRERNRVEQSKATKQNVALSWCIGLRD